MDWMIILQAVVLALIPILGIIALHFLKKFLDNLKNEKHRELIVKIAKGAAQIVADIAIKTPNKWDDAIAEALKEIADQLGQEKLDDQESIIAKAALNKETMKMIALKNNIKFLP